MNRRAFLTSTTTSSLGAVIPITVITATTKQERPDLTPHPQGGVSYKGWHIWHWTGWKARYTKAQEHWDKCRLTCSICENLVKSGQKVKLHQGSRLIEHAECDGTPDYVAGQWCAELSHPKYHSENRYIEVGAGARSKQEYKKGDDFDIKFDLAFTSSTDSIVLEIEKQRAFNELLDYIDELTA